MERQELARGKARRRPWRSDDADAVVGDTHARGPPGQKFVNHRIQPLFRGIPRLHEVVVQRHLVDRGDGRVGVRVRGQEHLAGVGVQLAGFANELGAAHAGHALVDEKQGDGRPALFELAHDVEALVGGTGTKDAVVASIALAQISLDGSQHLGIIIDGEKNWFDHAVIDETFTLCQEAR
jgi:hypothetical protein